MDAGTVIGGRFRLDERLAAGGMGAVWRAHDLRLERDAAIKVLRSGLDDANRPVDRFSREATTLAKLKGTGFVEIYDFGEEEVDGLTVRYIAMELIETGSLGRLLAERGRLTSEETLRLLAEAAAALEKAHRIGVVHRDVKPANLLIDEDGHVRVVDFGISLLNSSPRLTPTSAVFGTLAYIAPEQLRRGEVTGRSDVYALGAVAYECLTGAAPFDASDPAAEMHGHLYEDPPALPEEIAPEAAAIVMRCLRKEPEERFPSAADLAAACHAALGVSPALGLTPAAFSAKEAAERVTEPDPDDTRPERRDRRRWLLPVVVVVPLVTAGTVTALWRHVPIVGDLGQEATTGATVSEPTTSEAAATSAAAEEPTTEAEDTDTEAPEPDGTDSGETDSGDTDTGGGEDDTGGNDDSGGDEAHEPATGTVPDVMNFSTHDAKAELAAAGFDNVYIEGKIYSWFGIEWDHCQVLEQSPQGGSTADYDDQIVLGYYTDTDEDIAECS